MDEKVKHTPPPWKISCAKGLDVYDRDGHVVFRSRLPEDAEFIVRAVNNFDQMLATLKLCFEEWPERFTPCYGELKKAIAQAEKS